MTATHDSILSLKLHNRKIFWPQSSSTVCHVIHQALMMVIRNQFGTTVESCQSIMFNVVIHMKREKERLAMIYDTRMAYNVIINNRFVKFQPSINVQLGIYYLDQFCSSKKQLSQLTDTWVVEKTRIEKVVFSWPIRSPKIMVTKFEMTST